MSELDRLDELLKRKDDEITHLRQLVDALIAELYDARSDEASNAAGEKVTERVKELRYQNGFRSDGRFR